jgi:hypothetical protein
VFEALVHHLPQWWVSVEGEQQPAVLESVGGTDIVWSSPFLWRPNDQVELRLDPGEDAGCVMEVRHTSGEPFHPLEASTIRHRWGEHIDRDLRDFLDEGSTRPYRFTTYRADVADWSILATLEDRMWAVARPVWARAEVHYAPGRSWMAVPRLLGDERPLDPGTLLWSFAMCRHRSAVRCLAARPQDLGEQVVADWLRRRDRYRGFELVIPVAAFGKELEALDIDIPAQGLD